MTVLAALGAVDWVVPFSEDTPQRLIAEILPDLLVRGRLQAQRSPVTPR